MVLPSYRSISIRRAAKLLSVSRSTLYYKPEEEKEENIKLMELIDEKYTQELWDQEDEGISSKENRKENIAKESPKAHEEDESEGCVSKFKDNTKHHCSLHRPFERKEDNQTKSVMVCGCK